MFDWRTENLTSDELNHIFYSTNMFIVKITNDRAGGPYWTDRMRWVDMLMAGRFTESVTKDHVVCTIRNNPLTFEYIITSKLYKYLVCYYEISRWIEKNYKNNNANSYNMHELLILGRKNSNGVLSNLTLEERHVLDHVFFDGTTIANCLSNFAIPFRRNIKKIEQSQSAGKSRANKYNTKKRKQRKRVQGKSNPTKRRYIKNTFNKRKSMKERKSREKK